MSWLKPIGVFNVVEDEGASSQDDLMIRAHRRPDPETLRDAYLPALGEIDDVPNHDYRCGTSASRGPVLAAAATMVGAIRDAGLTNGAEEPRGTDRADMDRQVSSVLHAAPVSADSEREAEWIGAVVVSGGGRVLLRRSTGEDQLPEWTFAVAQRAESESSTACAVRAVAEQTGYQARVLMRLPGLFEEGHDACAYFLMEADHPPGPMRPPAAEMVWVFLERASEQLRETANLQVRARDLAVLSAAREAFEAIPYAVRPPVQPTDWKDPKPMGDQRVTLTADLSYSAEEFDCMRRGFYPTVMEQKWFVYLSAMRLQFHRSCPLCQTDLQHLPLKV